MSGQSRKPQGTPSRPADSDAVAGLLIVDSARLMEGRRELIIRHGTDVYRLRLTASNKLILTK